MELKTEQISVGKTYLGKTAGAFTILKIFTEDGKQRIRGRIEDSKLKTEFFADLSALAEWATGTTELT